MLIQNNQIRFLIATDVHLGHKEKHPVRKDDSFQAFQEVLQNAKKQNVDFLLLGGDLFDEVNPSKECFFRCLTILRTNVFGNKQVKIKVTLNGEPYNSNFANQIVNVSLPVFTIHGNHDYPSNQFGKISACDLLQASNYVNYFGKHLNLHQILIRPLIISKEGTNTKIALYGLGYIKDPILNDLFEQNKAIFQKPVGDIKDYVTIFVLHQNRFKKNFKPGVPISNCFRPTNIPQWINLTIWGHQHQAIYKLESQFDRPIYQPGSTILTSFIEAQSFKKQCVLVKATNTKYTVDSILLAKSFRPMFCMNFQLKNLKEENGEDFNLFDFLDSTIASVLKESLHSYPHRKPIIRIKVEYSGLSQIIRLQQLQSKYSSMVGNGQKIVVFWKRKQDKPSLISDAELFDNIKNKKLTGFSNGGINQEVQQLIKQKIQKAQFCFFSNEFFNEMSTFISKEQGQNNILAKKRLADMQIKKRKQIEEDITKMNEHKEKQIKRSLRYNYLKKQFLCKGILTSQYKSPEDLLKTQQSVLNSHKLSIHFRLMEEKVGLKPPSKQKSDTQPPQPIKVTNKNKIVRTAIIKRQSDFIDLDRSESQDCCERALKQPIDEEGTKLRFQEAQMKIEQKNVYQLKKTDKPNKQQKQPVRGGQKVRFSRDLF